MRDRPRHGLSAPPIKKPRTARYVELFGEFPMFLKPIESRVAILDTLRGQCFDEVLVRTAPYILIDIFPMRRLDRVEAEMLRPARRATGDQVLNLHAPIPVWFDR